MGGVLLNKNELRKFFLSKVSEISKERQEKASQTLYLKLLEVSKNHSLIASFASVGSEINTWKFNLEMIKQQKLALPRVSGKNLIFYKVFSIEDLERSNFGILEPKIMGPPLAIDVINLFIVPGVAFDKNNQRLGKGRGFYDYFISLHGIKNTLGVGYKEQLSNSPLPLELHDKALKDVLFF